MGFGSLAGEFFGEFLGGVGVEDYGFVARVLGVAFYIAINAPVATA